MLIITFLIGIVINAMGYVPPGNINLTLAQLTINRGMRQAWGFILAFSCVEVFFTFGMMRFARWISSDVDIDAIKVGDFQLSILIDVFMMVLLLVMATLAWKNRDKVHQPKATEDSRKGSVLYGIILGVLNPVQIPYWLFFGNYVILHEWITTTYPSLIVFSLGSGVGSMVALYGYAHFAKFIQEKFTLSSRLINQCIAVFLYCLALYLLIKQLVICFG
ncbi:LysE family transporter [Pedobacter sp. UBA4863]|uniref:LysE family transporter n=1 Tax=Pedobacter sp. UBA4863 TaxID=1947060 RepID=UPI0025CC15F7|nr:LysE family transporter [Pedobacter sp. UBA4863]